MRPLRPAESSQPRPISAGKKKRIGVRFSYFPGPGDDGSKMVKPVRTAFTAPVVKAPEPLLWCSSRQADQPAIFMAPCSAARPFVVKKTAEQVPRISASPLRAPAVQRPLGDGAGRRQQALGVPDRPSRCFTRAVYRAAPAQVRAHGCGEAAAHQPPRRRSSAVRGGSCRSARAAARPAAGLSRGSRFGG